MLHLFKVCGQRFIYNSESNNYIKATPLMFQMVELLKMPLTPLCPTHIRYALAKYDSQDVNDSYNSIYNLINTSSNKIMPNIIDAQSVINNAHNFNDLEGLSNVSYDTCIKLSVKDSNGLLDIITSINNLGYKSIYLDFIDSIDVNLIFKEFEKIVKEYLKNNLKINILNFDINFISSLYNLNDVLLNNSIPNYELIQKEFECAIALIK